MADPTPYSTLARGRPSPAPADAIAGTGSTSSITDSSRVEVRTMAMIRERIDSLSSRPASTDNSNNSTATSPSKPRDRGQVEALQDENAALWNHLQEAVQTTHRLKDENIAKAQEFEESQDFANQFRQMLNLTEGANPELMMLVEKQKGKLVSLEKELAVVQKEGARLKDELQTSTEQTTPELRVALDRSKEDQIKHLQDDSNTWQLKSESLSKLHTQLRHEHLDLLQKYNSLQLKASSAQEVIDQREKLAEALEAKNLEIANIIRRQDRDLQEDIVGLRDDEYFQQEWEYLQYTVHQLCLRHFSDPLPATDSTFDFSRIVKTPEIYLKSTHLRPWLMEARLWWILRGVLFGNSDTGDFPPLLNISHNMNFYLRKILDHATVGVDQGRVLKRYLIWRAQTVTHVLSGSDEIPPDAMKRVMALAQEMPYQSIREGNDQESFLEAFELLVLNAAKLSVEFLQQPAHYGGHPHNYLPESLEESDFGVISTSYTGHGASFAWDRSLIVSPALIKTVVRENATEHETLAKARVVFP